MRTMPSLLESLELWEERVLNASRRQHASLQRAIATCSEAWARQKRRRLAAEPICLPGAPPVPGVSRTEAGQQDPGSQTSTDPAGRGADPRRTMPDPRLMLLVCQTLMPDLGRTRPDAAPDAG